LTDGVGNVTGGVRNVQVDVPIATLRGLGNSPVPNCTLFGTTTPFSATQIVDLYKNHGQFVSRWAKTAQQEVAAGFLLPTDVDHLVASAGSSDVAK
jgi:hypothetical protein